MARNKKKGKESISNYSSFPKKMKKESSLASSNTTTECNDNDNDKSNEFEENNNEKHVAQRHSISPFSNDTSNNNSCNDIFSSIFGGDDTYSSECHDRMNNIDKNCTNVCNDLFSSSQAQRLDLLSKNHIMNNQKSLDERNCVKESVDVHAWIHSKKVELNYTRKDIIESRKKLNSSQISIDAIKSITIKLSDINLKRYAHGDENKGEDDDEIESGIMRLFINRANAIMCDHGVLIIKNDQKKSNLFESSLLQSMVQKSKQIEHDVYHRLSKKGRIWQKQNDLNNADLEQDCAFRYHEVASRCFGRLDIRYGMDEFPFSSKDVVANKFLLPIIHSLLGESAKLLYAGLILSFPDSADQPWHQDGSALFDEHDVFSSDIHLPPYALNVFIPLDHVSLEIGPTEFYLGSHFSEVARGIIQENTTHVQGIPAIGPLLNRGDVLIYDYRVCHRGTSNLTMDKTRPMLYLMYARPWFYEHLNFGEEHLFRK